MLYPLLLYSNRSLSSSSAAWTKVWLRMSRSSSHSSPKPNLYPGNSSSFFTPCSGRDSLLSSNRDPLETLSLKT